jgi:hypothetical protein
LTYTLQERYGTDKRGVVQDSGAQHLRAHTGDARFQPPSCFLRRTRFALEPTQAGIAKTPTRKRRARGRIEHTLLDEGRSLPSDLRPSPAKTSYHRKVTSVSLRRRTNAGRGTYTRLPRPCKWWGGLHPLAPFARPGNNQISSTHICALEHISAWRHFCAGFAAAQKLAVRRHYLCNAGFASKVPLAQKVGILHQESFRIPLAITRSASRFTSVLP